MYFSPLSLGFWKLASWNYTPLQLLSFISECMDLGITTFDHADIYGNYSCEELFGNAMHFRPALRQKMQLVTKCGIRLVSDKRPEHSIKSYDTSRKHIIRSAERSLTALRTDFIDLLLIHRPDPFMDPDETAEAFYSLKKDGKVLEFGVSNFLPFQFDLLQSRLDFSLVTNQVEISVLHPDAFHNGIIAQCQQYRIKPMAWSPLGGGRLFTSNDPQVEKLRDVLIQTGYQIGGYSKEQVAIAWLLNHPANIEPVLGSGNIEHLRMLCKSISIRLTREQWFTIYKAATGSELP